MGDGTVAIARIPPTRDDISSRRKEEETRETLQDTQPRGTPGKVAENPCCLFFSRMQVRFPVVAGPAGGKVAPVDHQVGQRATDHR